MKKGEKPCSICGVNMWEPATSNFVPDERFDGEVEDTSRHRTHQTEKLPVDFVATHPYPTLSYWVFNKLTNRMKEKITCL